MRREGANGCAAVDQPASRLLESVGVRTDEAPPGGETRAAAASIDLGTQSLELPEMGEELRFL